MKRRHPLLVAIETLSDALDEEGLSGAMVLLHGSHDGQLMLDMLVDAGYDDIEDRVATGAIKNVIWRTVGDDVLQVAWPAECSLNPPGAVQ